MQRFLVMAVAAAMAATPAIAAERADLLIRHATIVDVAGGKTLAEQAIAVRGGDIIDVGEDAALSGRYEATHSIDASGKFVMPGLWDMHVHFGGGPELIEENKSLLPLYVAYGVTTVRDAAADLSGSVLQWRGDVAAGRLLGPTIYTSGPKLEGYKPLWKGTIEVGTPAEVDAALDRLQAMKVDFVKITDNTLKPEIFAYGLKAAKARGLKTSAHTRAPRLSDQGRLAAGSVDRRRLCRGQAELRRGLGQVRREFRSGLCQGDLRATGQAGPLRHPDAEHEPHPRPS